MKNNHEPKPVTITDLLDISEFKMALYQDLIVIYIKYPINTDRCLRYVYNSRSILHKDGKFVINNNVTICRNKYYIMSNLKTEVFNNYCTINTEDSCFIRILNG